MARFQTIQIARVIEITEQHYHLMTMKGQCLWVAKAHSSVSVRVDDSVQIVLKTKNWVRRWWIESKNGVPTSEKTDIR